MAKFAIVLWLALIWFQQEAFAFERDLRVRTEPNEYEVSFCARPSPNEFSFPGHAFVAFTEQRGNSREFIAIGKTTATGVSSASAALSYFGTPVEGAISQEYFSHLKQECLVVQVNYETFKAATTAAQPRLAALGIDYETAVRLENYTLGTDDCIAFVIEVATSLKAAGLIVPSRTFGELPISYIERLTAANS